MLSSLYIEAAKKRGSIKEFLLEKDKEGDISKMWEDIPINPSSNKFSLGAGDGSFNKKKFLGFTFYAVGCESLVFDGEFIKNEESIVDIIEQDNYIDDILGLYMGIFETKYAVKTIEEYDVDYYLFDGSLFGDLIRPFPSKFKISKDLREEILNNTLDELENNIKYLNFKLQSPRIIEKYYLGYQNELEYKLFLASIEQLLYLKNLLKYKNKVIAISKSSTSKDIFRSNIPDIYIFDKYTKKAGISVIRYKKVFDEVGHDFLIYDEFFKNLEFTVFYLRLEDNKNVLKVELPYRASKEEILAIAKKIKKYSTNGYPYLLKKAHKDVVISKKDIDKLVKIVNIHEKIGREMLN